MGGGCGARVTSARRCTSHSVSWARNMTMTEADIITGLVVRSNRLGRDSRNTNHVSGNASTKGIAIDPVTAGSVE